MSQEIDMPEKIDIIDTARYLQTAHSALFDENIPRSEIQQYINKAMSELHKIANVSNEWQSLFFKIANKIH